MFVTTACRLIAIIYSASIKLCVHHLNIKEKTYSLILTLVKKYFLFSQLRSFRSDVAGGNVLPGRGIQATIIFKWLVHSGARINLLIR